MSLTANPVWDCVRLTIPTPEGIRTYQLTLNGADRKRQRRESRASPKRLKTKEKLASKIKNSSLPLWLADIVVDFDPEDSTFWDLKLKPELEKRKELQGYEDLTRFKQQVDSLKRFILINYPSIVSDQVAQRVQSAEFANLDEEEQIALQQVKNYMTRPRDLLRLQRQANRKTKKNRVHQALVDCNLFKESFTRISLI